MPDEPLGAGASAALAPPASPPLPVKASAPPSSLALWRIHNSVTRTTNAQKKFGAQCKERERERPRSPDRHGNAVPAHSHPHSACSLSHNQHTHETRSREYPLPPRTLPSETERVVHTWPRRRRRPAVSPLLPCCTCSRSAAASCRSASSSSSLSRRRDVRSCTLAFCRTDRVTICSRRMDREGGGEGEGGCVCVCGGGGGAVGGLRQQ
jgi:hypothetical protein